METKAAVATALVDDQSLTEDTSKLTENIESQASSITYEIEKIVECKKDENGKTLFKARWVAYTWIPEDCLLSSFQQLIDDYFDENKELNAESMTQISEVGMVEVAESASQELPATIDVSEDTTIAESILPESNTDVIESEIQVHAPMEIQSYLSNVIYCPKCNQRFFLKSNFEVHVLFCEGKSTIAVNDFTMTKMNMTDASTKPLSTEEVAMLESQAYEYVPVDSSSNQDCDACSRRFPAGASDGSAPTGIAELLANSRKKIVSDKVEVYECDQCNREFLYKHPVQSDLTTVESVQTFKTSNKPYKCSICNRSFDTENDMLEHEVKHANTPSRYTCGSCNEKFVTRNALEAHYDETTNECHPRKCDICARTFVHANHLKRHLTIHAGIKPFVCSICSHEFNQKSDLFRHEKRHTVDGKLSCSKCVQVFDDIEDLREHAKVHRRDDNVKLIFTCDRCGKTFGRKSHYKRHLSIHDGVKPHSCEHCGKSFNQRTDLKRHYLSHIKRDKEKQLKTSSFECRLCKKTFTNRSSYLQHGLVHQKIMNTGAIY